MRSPWYRPYCNLTSNRRSNVSAHVARKHPGLYNPLPELKQNRPFNSYFSPQPQNQPVNPNLSSNTSFDPLQEYEKSTKLQKVLQEIRQMDKMEITFLLCAINQIHFGKLFQKLILICFGSKSAIVCNQHISPTQSIYR